MAKTWGLVLRNLKGAWHGDTDHSPSHSGHQSSSRAAWKPKKFSRKKTKQNKPPPKKREKKKSLPYTS